MAEVREVTERGGWAGKVGNRETSEEAIMINLERDGVVVVKVLRNSEILQESQ